ncbi:hypothetical protein LCGC14_3159410 [marine sediment metagenome]|uniref:Uncharacterized protein n=1 Tax=marine sediment metagenome TaxID=412755 RepID=A0A0F8XYH1_9ZZZZ
MGGSVIFPSLTDQMVLGVFKYLVEAELRKNLKGQSEFRFGCQEGMIGAITLMFGEADDLTVETAYDNGRTWLHIIEEIRDELPSWVDALQNATDVSEIDFEKMQNAIDLAVNNHALKHPNKLGDALRVNL